MRSAACSLDTPADCLLGLLLKHLHDVCHLDYPFISSYYRVLLWVAVSWRNKVCHQGTERETGNQVVEAKRGALRDGRWGGGKPAGAQLDKGGYCQTESCGRKKRGGP
ncbi:hypothetical protein GMLC_12950 [Geomonas limicola]|uniref:Uncharacterized protein n=1 Tax=Geomonas limicola TaxID=2740186 RepID=A0A6V8N5A7_9BACT|nr:hypothetical protein GMLC_12950 [Geomonas limicola]